MYTDPPTLSSGRGLWGVRPVKGRCWGGDARGIRGLPGPAPTAPPSSGTFNQSPRRAPQARAFARGIPGLVYTGRVGPGSAGLCPMPHPSHRESAGVRAPPPPRADTATGTALPVLPGPGREHPRPGQRKPCPPALRSAHGACGEGGRAGRGSATETRQKQDEEQKTRQDRRIQPEKAADGGGDQSRGGTGLQAGRPQGDQGSARARRGGHRPGTGTGLQAGAGRGPGAGAALHRPRQRTTTPHTLSVPCISYLEAP